MVITGTDKIKDLTLGVVAAVGKKVCKRGGHRTKMPISQVGFSLSRK